MSRTWMTLYLPVS